MKFLIAIVFIVVFIVVIGCVEEKPAVIEPTTTTSTTIAAVTTSTLPAVKAPLVALSWEKTKPTRKEWSQYIYGLMSSDYFAKFIAAKDWPRFCTKYDSLSLEQRATLFSEFFSATSFYESSWNEASQSVDVGTTTNKDSWSIGLMQISVRDYQNKFKYTFEQLITAKPNLHLAAEILAIQIQKTGLVILPNTSKNRYWAVLLEGNKYQKISQITEKTNALPFCN